MLETLKLAFQLRSPERVERARAYDHEHLRRSRKELQDLIHEPWEVVDDRDGRFVLGERSISEIALVERGKEQGSVRKDLLAMSPGERGCRDRPTVTIRSGLGRLVKADRRSQPPPLLAV